MNFYYNLVIYLWILMNFITTCFCLYHLVIAIAGFFKKKNNVEPTKYHRFAAVISARNEENVIGNLIESIKLQNYPSGLIDIIVIADNCDDHTAEVCEKAGAIVYKRFNKAEVGKGFALKFAYEKIFEERDFYDAFCVFDADNLIDSDFFYHMNKSLCAGFNVAQGYRDMKNPSDTWISGDHSIFYWMENRFYNCSRSFFGLSATINGTGYMIRSDFLKKVGWNIKTVTEDLEFTMQTVLSGNKVGWVPEAVVYDEQPLSMQQSMRQRQRWTSGFMQCCYYYFKDFIKKLISKPDWVVLDMFMFVASFPVMVIGVCASVICFFMSLFRFVDPVNLILNTCLLLFASLVGFWLIAVVTIIMEKKPAPRLKRAIFFYPIFNVTWVIIYLICFFKRNIDWKPIAHVRSISIKDMDTFKAK